MPIDFSQITACGECCAGCGKKADGRCEGCIESDGHCKEWAQSRGCPIHKCARRHGVQFCGLCHEFPCKWLVEKVTWNPHIVEDLTGLAGQYRQKELDDSIQIMTGAIQSILGGANPTIYLFGSVVLGDFKLGWSDIDILVLTDRPIGKRQARKLVKLRQRLMKEYRGNPYFRLFEGGMLSKRAFFGNEKDTVVYWGTSGQRLTDEYRLDSFAVAELLDCGMLLCGEDVRDRMAYPTHVQFKADIQRHYNAVRQHGQNTNATKGTQCGWLLDIARGLYTLRTDKVIAKTAAGEWALADGLAPEPDILRRAVEIRRDPLKYIDNPQAIAWCAALGEHNMAFADVLEQELSIH